MSGRNNVRKRGTTWTYYIYVTGKDGKRRQISKGGSRTRRHAEGARVEVLNAIRTGTFVRPERITLGQFLEDEWLPSQRPPTLETVVVPVCREDKGRLRTALAQLAEQDPLIDVRQDDVRQEISVSLYGEVQKEVIGATLAAEFGLDVTFRETTTICIERPVGTGSAAGPCRIAVG